MLLGFTVFYWILTGFTGFSWVLLGCRCFYRAPSFLSIPVLPRLRWVLLGQKSEFGWVFECFIVQLGLTEIEWVLLGFYCVILGFLVCTGLDWVLPSLNGFYWVFLVFSWVFIVSLLGFISFYWIY